ncbi:MAG: HupE/UreJ family protein [Myxococcales bacterium]|nr:HupE/UreJ family protein [Myxococcales bacterium]
MRRLLLLLGMTALALTGHALAHDAGSATARFAVAADGIVAVHIEIAAVDVRELMGVGAETRLTQAEFDAALTAALPEWLGLGADGVPCRLDAPKWSPLGLQGLAIDTKAHCPAAPVMLDIDWRAATHARLKLGAVATVIAPDGAQTPLALNPLAPRASVTVGDVSTIALLLRFGATGVEHILGGWDHLSFLLALMLACSRARRLLAVVTGFTVAHSITLALGATEIIVLSPKVVEPIIAGSIAVAAVHDLLLLRRGRLDHPGRRDPVGSWLLLLLAVCFGFGLVHGLGFAGLLNQALPADAPIVGPLLGFNLGVEIGQIACVLVAWPILRWIGGRTYAPRVFGVLLVGLVALGVGVAIQRIIG